MNDFRRLGFAWIGFSLALALHVTDEALTGFLSVYNPTVLALRTQIGFWPMPTFTFGSWLTGLIVAVALSFLASRFAFRNVSWFRPVMYVLAIAVGLLNAIGHTLATIFARTIDSVRIARPAPGFYSSPLLFAAACWVLIELRRSARRES